MLKIYVQVPIKKEKEKGKRKNMTCFLFFIFLFLCSSGHRWYFSLRRASPKPSAVKPLPHLLLQLLNFLVVFAFTARQNDAVFGGDRVNLPYFVLVATSPARRRRERAALLGHPAAALLPHRPPAEPRRDLVHGQYQEV